MSGKTDEPNESGLHVKASMLSMYTHDSTFDSQQSLVDNQQSTFDVQRTIGTHSARQCG